MTTESEYAVDRTGWPSGPWDGEPDKVQFRTRAGLPGLIVRSNMTGALCGYVGVPNGHPAYERTWMSEDSYERDTDGQLDYERPKPNPLNDLSVHGGITYADKCGGAVCHVPEPGEPDDVWWICFDCQHCCDLSPSDPRPFMSDSEYREVEYVRGEIESLADQLAALTSAPEASRP